MERDLQSTLNNGPCTHDFGTRSIILCNLEVQVAAMRWTACMVPHVSAACLLCSYPVPLNMSTAPRKFSEVV